MKKLLLVLCFSMFLALQPVSVLANSPAIGWDPVDTNTITGGTDVSQVAEEVANNIVKDNDVLPANTVASAITAFKLTADKDSVITVSVKSILPNVSVICFNGKDYELVPAKFTSSESPVAARTTSVENKGEVTFMVPSPKDGAANYNEFVVVSTKKVVDPTPVPTEKPVPTSNPVGETPTSPNTSAFPIETAIASFATLSLAGGLVLRKKRNS